MYGTQASVAAQNHSDMFENDVKIYGTQAAIVITIIIVAFENDVKMYDIRCSYNRLKLCVSLVKR